MVSPIINMPNPLGKAWPMSGRPTQLFVQHSAECPLRGGYAQSLTNASNTVPSYQASWHGFCDPIARVRQIPWYLGAWTQGVANQYAIGMEVAGYARFTKEDWLTPEGLKQLENTAHEWAYYWRTEKANGNEIDLRWITTDEVNAVKNGNRDISGFCTHGQIEPGSRWDPGPNFPYDRLLNRVKQLVGNAPAPVEKELTVAEADRIINAFRSHMNALLLNGYTTGGEQFPGIVEEIRGISSRTNRYLDTKVSEVPEKVAKARVNRGGKPETHSWRQDTADGTSAILRVEAKLEALMKIAAAGTDLTAAEVKVIVEEVTEGVLQRYFEEKAVDPADSDGETDSILDELKKQRSINPDISS